MKVSFLGQQPHRRGSHLARALSGGIGGLLLAACGSSPTQLPPPPSSGPDGSGTNRPASDGSSGGSSTGSSGDPRAAAVDSPTFWQDVAPLLNEKCVGCHQAGGIAPFALDNYADARTRANQMAALTQARIMPPYLIETGGDCGSFDETRALSGAQIELISDWVAGGTLEGSAAELAVPELPSLGSARQWSTPLFVPEIQGGTLAEFDEYRCFRVDLGLTEDTWVTGSEVLPGNLQMVHHVIGMIVDPDEPTPNGTNREIMQALDDESPDREGWPCFAAAGESVSVESEPVLWAPGAGASLYPDGLGVRVPQGRELVVQVHYNLADAALRGQSDQTQIQLQFADDVERQAFFVPEDKFLDTVYGAQPAKLEPGRSAVPYTWTASLAEIIGASVPIALDLVQISPHMHQRGRKWTLELGSNGDFECIGRVNRWDFNWQAGYTYTTPPQLLGNSELRLTCEYDTSDATEPVLPGWGTRNEMCLVTMMIALPPGVRF
ncbi:MAG TPA: hypothetical protein VJU61_21300 [Polyangiaceae bacterium]|nr:hypothetical protein [Polyangiaceae bacterium]